MSDTQPNRDRLAALEARFAALEARLAAQDVRMAALEARMATREARLNARDQRIKQKPARPARPARPVAHSPFPSTATDILATLKALGGSATVAQLRERLPQRAKSSIRRTCQELRNAGKLRHTALGVYELMDDQVRD
jgi:hypothetical protein